MPARTDRPPQSKARKKSRQKGKPSALAIAVPCHWYRYFEDRRQSQLGTVAVGVLTRSGFFHFAGRYIPELDQYLAQQLGLSLVTGHYLSPQRTHYLPAGEARLLPQVLSQASGARPGDPVVSHSCCPLWRRDNTAAQGPRVRAAQYHPHTQR